ncbi:thiamine diphosphokinase [Fictibacillus aquaticus]|uniref:Thiamine diphosphokinase n=1 Tax=Fictibacillus aquaticus TaxID=2021314 RepID=A0A235FC39_9BACL|nr:thiamine diphosphokinase [Fictibacillus aquaticus]OYD58898.1 thiamine diphosphokinase [Fictibacillus aquaticus]
MQHKILIAAGGPEEYWPDLGGTKNTIYCGADRGVFSLVKRGITPDYAFGDFDSVTVEEKKTFMKKKTVVFEYEEEKNETDLELALDWAVRQKPSLITIIGATGGRLDHSLINVQMLLKGAEYGVKTVLKDRQNEIELFFPGTYTLTRKELEGACYVSFLSYSEKVEGLTLEGFKYPLSSAVLHAGSSRCISNELAEKNGTYSFNAGILMMVKSRD